MNARRSVFYQLLALALAIGMSMMTLPLFWGGSMGGRNEAAPVESLLPLAMMFGVFAATFGVIRGRSVPAVGIFRSLAVSSLLFTGQMGIVWATALTHGAFTVRLLLALVFGIFVGLAPIVARVQQNPWFGVRTPWTLGSRRVWRDTHQATGKLWFFGGILGSALAMFGAPIVLVIGYLLLLGLSPILISYSAWRKLGRP